jgi:hypothetical protein
MQVEWSTISVNCRRRRLSTFAVISFQSARNNKAGQIRGSVQKGSKVPEISADCMPEQIGVKHANIKFNNLVIVF